MDELNDDHASAPDDIVALGKKKKREAMMKKANTLRKAPQAPKRFKSSYICFFMAKQNEIKEELGDEANVTNISKRSAEMWKNLPPEERAHWDDIAAKDKERFMVEKSTYTGPWQVPWKRSKKHPSAPKRPMSAFLYFSQGRRSVLKQQNPDMKNTEVSRLLGEMWRDLPEDEKRPFVDKEREEREKYKVAMADWKKEFEAKTEADRKAQHMAAGAAQTQLSQYPDAVTGYGNMPQQYMYQPHQHPHPHAGYPYAYAAGPYTFPTDGKTPVVLGPNGTPHYPHFGNPMDDRGDSNDSDM